MSGGEEHIVALGHHLTRIATIHRFRSYGPLWNDPGNAALRKQRPNPNILAVGDRVHVPDLNFQEVDRPTERRHRFRAEIHPLELRLAFRTWDGKPRDEEPSEVTIDGKPATFAAAGAGAVVVPVDGLSDRCRVLLGGDPIVVRVGFLQPVDTVPGIRERLNNLGYDAGEKDDPADRQLRSAIEEFQCDHKLLVDGIAGRDTQTTLARVHGC